MKNKRLISVLLIFVLLLAFAPSPTASAKVYSLGDLSGDGKITSSDARMILRVAAKIDSFSEAQEKAADVNRSGKVNSGDARTALRVAAKIETLTVGENEVFDDGRRESALDPANDATVPAFIETMNSGRYLLRGTMTDNTEGETIPITFAKSGEDIRMSAELSGIALDMAQIDGTLYLISVGKKSYIEMTESIMNTLGLDPDDLDLDFGEIYEGGELDWTQREYDGRTVECCISASEEGTIEFYIENGTILMLRMLEPSGVYTTEIVVEEFRGGVTQEEIAIPADYEKKSYVSFIADIMGDTEYEPDPYARPDIDELTPLDWNKEQILAKYTEVMNNTKAGAKSFIMDEWTDFDNLDAGVSTALVGNILDSVLGGKNYSEGVYSDNPALIPPMNSVGVGCSLTDADAIKEARITEYDNGKTEIRIELKNERNPEPMDPTTGVSPSFTGGIFDVVSRNETERLIREKVKSIPGLTVTGFATEYYDSFVFCIFDTKTCRATDVWFFTNMHTEFDGRLIMPVSVRVDMIHSVDLSNIKY